MQHINASDYMSGSAKQAVDTALTDARSQRVGGTPSEGTGTAPAPGPGPAEAVRPAAQA